MMNNIIFGPLLMFDDEKQIPFLCEDLEREYFLPLYIVRKGELYEQMKKRFAIELQDKCKGLIVSFGFIKPDSE